MAVSSRSKMLEKQGSSLVDDKGRDICLFSNVSGDVGYHLLKCETTLVEWKKRLTHLYQKWARTRKANPAECKALEYHIGRLCLLTGCYLLKGEVAWISIWKGRFCEILKTKCHLISKRNLWSTVCCKNYTSSKNPDQKIWITDLRSQISRNTFPNL